MSPFCNLAVKKNPRASLPHPTDKRNSCCHTVSPNWQVGPLLEKLLELADKAKLGGKTGTATAAAGDKQPSPANLDETSAGASDGNAHVGAKGALGTGQARRDTAPTATKTTTTTTTTSNSSSSSSAAAKAGTARLASMGYGDIRGPFWVRREIALMMGSRMFHREVDPDNVCIAAGATSVLRCAQRGIAASRHSSSSGTSTVETRYHTHSSSCTCSEHKRVTSVECPDFRSGWRAWLEDGGARRQALRGSPLVGCPGCMSHVPTISQFPGLSPCLPRCLSYGSTRR